MRKLVWKNFDSFCDETNKDLENFSKEFAKYGGVIAATIEQKHQSPGNIVDIVLNIGGSVIKIVPKVNSSGETYILVNTK